MNKLLPTNVLDNTIYDTSDIPDPVTAKKGLKLNLKQKAKYQKIADRYNDEAYRYNLYLTRYCIGKDCEKINTTELRTYSYEDDYGSYKLESKQVNVQQCTTCGKTWCIE